MTDPFEGLEIVEDAEEGVKAEGTDPFEGLEIVDEPDAPPADSPLNKPITEPAEPGTENIVAGNSPEARESQLRQENERLKAQLAAQPAPEPSVWDRFTGAVDSASKSKVGDFFRGVGRGVLSDWADEAAAALVPEVDDDTGIPRTYAEGSADEAMLAHQRKEQQEAQERSPALTGVGRFTGAAAQGILTAPAMPAAVGLRGAMAANAAQGLAMGAAQAAGAAEEDKAQAALEGGAWGAVLGGAAPAVMHGIGAVAKPAARKIAEHARSFANRNRAAASGAYGAELAKLAERHGPEFVEELGENIERLGLHERQGAMASPWVSTAAGAGLGGAYGLYTSDEAELGDRLMDAGMYAVAGGLLGRAAKGLPSTPTVYRDNAMRVAGELGDQLNTSIAEATEQGVSFPKEELLARMSRIARQNTDLMTDEGMASRAHARKLMERVGRKFDEHVTPAQLQKLKKLYEKRGGFKPDKNLPAGEAERRLMYRALASAPRTALRESIEGLPATAEREAVQGLALPETAEAFSRARQDFGIAKTVKNLARKRVAQEQGNQILSLPTAAASPGGVVPAATFEGLKRIGRDVLADVGRGVQRSAEHIAGMGPRAAPEALEELAEVPATGLRAVMDRVDDAAADAARPLAPGIAAGYGAGRLATPPYGMAAAADDDAQYEPPPPTPAMEQQAREQRTPPSSLRDAVEAALNRNDAAAIFGPNAEKFSNALIAEDPNAIDDLIKSMSLPGGDAYFRTQTFPALQRIAAEGQRP